MCVRQAPRALLRWYMAAVALDPLPVPLAHIITAPHTRRVRCRSPRTPATAPTAGNAPYATLPRVRLSTQEADGDCAVLVRVDMRLC